MNELNSGVPSFIKTSVSDISVEPPGVALELTVNSRFTRFPAPVNGVEPECHITTEALSIFTVRLDQSLVIQSVVVTELRTKNALLKFTVN